MTPPAVSIVIPLYNKGRYIEAAVASALAQTFGDIEIVIIDDGSRDDGATRVGQIKDPRIVLIQQDNAGVAAPRHRGLHEPRAICRVSSMPTAGHISTDRLHHLSNLTPVFRKPRCSAIDSRSFPAESSCSRVAGAGQLCAAG